MITTLPGAQAMQARPRGHAAARASTPRCSTRRATRSSAATPGAADAARAVARDAAHALRRRRPLRRDLLVEVGPRDLPRRRRRPGSDEDGYVWVIGRVDDVINVSGHRMSTAEIESAIVAPPQGRRGRRHRRRPTRTPASRSPRSSRSRATARAPTSSSTRSASTSPQRIGKLARPKRIIWADDLPKTRSGKIMRRLLRDIAEGRELGDVTTLRDPDVMAQLQGKIAERQQRRRGLGATSLRGPAPGPPLVPRRHPARRLRAPAALAASRTTSRRSARSSTRCRFESRYLRFHGTGRIGRRLPRLRQRRRRRARRAAGPSRRPRRRGRSGYDRLNEPDAAEVAFAVAEDQQGRGWRRGMLEQLAEVAAEPRHHALRRRGHGREPRRCCTSSAARGSACAARARAAIVHLALDLRPTVTLAERDRRPHARRDGRVAARAAGARGRSRWWARRRARAAWAARIFRGDRRERLRGVATPVHPDGGIVGSTRAVAVARATSTSRPSSRWSPCRRRRSEAVAARRGRARASGRCSWCRPASPTPTSPRAAARGGAAGRASAPTGCGSSAPTRWASSTPTRTSRCRR